ncbi:MAG: hypothetical protein Q7R52_02950 [archaeon]|nr:hypothetical protein [archaeon]
MTKENINVRVDIEPLKSARLLGLDRSKICNDAIKEAVIGKTEKPFDDFKKIIQEKEYEISVLKSTIEKLKESKKMLVDEETEDEEIERKKQLMRNYEKVYEKGVI